MKHYLLYLLTALFFGVPGFQSQAQPDTTQADTAASDIPLVYQFDIKRQIDPTAWRIAQKSIDRAESLNADLILIHMNTYGGLVLSADSIRTKILNTDIPTWVFIDNNAASAGALISIACDRIYMRPGANIGAATVVSQEGEAMPDKYQSYMRSTMRSTAESHGADTLISGQDTTIRWKRDPKIAEAMVDPSVYIEGIIDTGKVLTFTASEAIQYGYAEGTAESIEEVIEKAGFEEYDTQTFTPTTMDKIMGALMSPVLQSIFIMLIIGGIYFELQSPGIGFALGVSVVGALLYFAPLYLEGLAANWEILLFVIGIGLLAVEIFAIPGFGIAGISGVILIVVGLTLSMVENFEFEMSGEFIEPTFKALFMVVASMTISLLLSIYLTRKLFTAEKGALRVLALHDTQQKEEGYMAFENLSDTMKGKEGITATSLRPAGRVIIDDEVYDAHAIQGFIEKDEQVVVMKYENGRLQVRKK